LLHPSRPIRELPASVEPADRQLASGLALLAGVEQTGLPAMRWFQFAPPAVLLGSSQRVETIDPAVRAASGVALHRRRSGGGAVLGDRTLLLLDVALPPDEPLYRHDVTEAYRWFGEVWASALAQLGIDAWVLPLAAARADTQTLAPALKDVCYGGRSPYEVLVSERKVVGLAQVRRRAGALLQAGVYLRWSPERTAALMRGTADDRAALAGLLAERVAGLNDLGGSDKISVAMVRAAVARALERHAGLVPTPDDWRDHERAALDEALPRYAALP
jgi:lipoate-protein ligase A